MTGRNAVSGTGSRTSLRASPHVAPRYMGRIDWDRPPSGAVYLAVLAVLVRDGEGCPYEIARKLRAEGFPAVSDPQVYGALRGLQSGNRVEREARGPDEGSGRWHYRLTDEGRQE